ncbi:MAG: pantothenate kinase [Firmicutes bacterium]|nr:pantothenate kinase [Bacillota bacterium]
MSVVLGIDVGVSTTKIVGYNGGKKLIGTLQVKAADQVTSLYGAVGNFLHLYSVPLRRVKTVVLTGVGASYVSDRIYEIPTYRVDEFKAIGLGGLKLTDLEQALVVSMGTGTAFVRATKDEVVHIGGSGVGGGTLMGLSERLFQENDIAAIAKLARNGNLNNVDLTIRDITNNNVIGSLPPEMTASNLGRIRHTATAADLALGLLNMIFQTVGMLAVFACRNDTIKDVVLTGAMTVFPQAREIFSFLEKRYGIRYLIPDNAIFATAIGAAYPYLDE